MSDFQKGRDADPDEPEGHVAPRDLTKSVDAPAGEWVDVPKGMVIAPGTEVDKDGILRLESGELAIWHHRSPRYGPCERYTDKSKFVTLEEVVYVNGAPWCPDCVEKKEDDRKFRELRDMFIKKAGEN